MFRGRSINLVSNVREEVSVVSVTGGKADESKIDRGWSVDITNKLQSGHIQRSQQTKTRSTSGKEWDDSPESEEVRCASDALNVYGTRGTHMT